MGAATHPRAPERRKGAGPRDWKPCPSAFRGSPDPCLRLLLWSGDWMQAEAQPQIKASSLDRPPGRLLRLPPERSGGLHAATGKFEPGGRFQSSRVGVAGPARLNKQPPEDMAPSSTWGPVGRRL